MLLHVIRHHVFLLFINNMIKSIKEVIGSSLTNFKSSEVTKSMVSQQIVERWGETELKNYDPFHNTRTFVSWLKLGFKVRKGEKALKSFTIVETKDIDGNVLKTYRHPISLFYYRSVEPITK